MYQAPSMATIVEALKSLGFVETGAPGRPSFFAFTDGHGGERIGASIRLQLPGLRGGVGSVYVHAPGVLVATGIYADRLRTREPDNATVGGKPGIERVYPAWRDRQPNGPRALSALLQSLKATPLE